MSTTQTQTLTELQRSIARQRAFSIILLAISLVLLIIILLLNWKVSQFKGTATVEKNGGLKLKGTVISLGDGSSVDISNLVVASPGTNGIDGTSGKNGSNGTVGPAGANGSVGVATAQNGTTLSGTTLEFGTTPLLHDTFLPQGGNDLYLDASVNNGSIIALGDPADVLSGVPGPGNPLAISGPGERLIWYPKKVALRAGEVDTMNIDLSPYGGPIYNGNEWDDANIGLASMALGYDTVASGNMSTAIGGFDFVTGSLSTAFGALNYVPGDQSIAIGGLNLISGQNSVNIGMGVFLFGSCFNTTTGSSSFNVGICNTLGGNNSTIIGDNNTTVVGANTNFIAGNQNTSSAPNAFVIGNNNAITGIGFAGLIGINSAVSGSNSLGIGTGLTVNGNNSLLTGYNLTSAVGANNTFGINVDDTTPVTMSNSNVIGFYGGKVGVNQTNPTHRFEVTDTSTDQTAAFTGTTQTCIVDTSGPGGWNCTSDLRLKTNIVNLNGSLDRLLQLQGVTYNFKSNPTGDQIAGFIAQDVQKVLPDLVGKDVNGYLNLNKEGMIPYIVEAVKTQNGKLDDVNGKLSEQGIKLLSISDELKSLSDRVTNTESEIDQLKAQHAADQKRLDDQELRLQKLESQLQTTP